MITIPLDNFKTWIDEQRRPYFSYSTKDSNLLIFVINKYDAFLALFKVKKTAYPQPSSISN